MRILCSGAAVLAFALLASACSEVLPTDPSLAPSDASFSHTSSTASAWTGSGPGTVTVVADGTSGDAILEYSASNIGYSTNTWTLETTASSAGTILLPWSYTGFHAYFNVTAYAEAFVTSNGVTTTIPLVSAGPANCCSSPSAGFSFSGNLELTLQAGDSYGFRFGGANFDSNNIFLGTFTVDLPESPISREQCKNGGWEAFGFRNQGQCIAFVNTGHDSR